MSLKEAPETMKIIKYLLFLLLILFIAGSIYVATKEGDLLIEESRVIPAPASMLYKEIAIQKEDTVDWFGTEGRLLQTGATPISSIDQELILNKSITDLQMESHWEFEPVEGGTRVSRRVSDNMGFKEKLAVILGDSDMEDDIRRSIEERMENLEGRVLQKMEEYSISVAGVTQHGGGFYMYMTTAAHNDEVYAKASEMIEQVNLYMRSNNISINGEPFIIYNERDENTGTSIFSAAVPTPSQVITPTGSQVLGGMMPAQKSVKITLKGNFKNAPEAWQSGYRYIEENELEVNPNSSPIEIFFTSPSEEENPALWVTEIYIPVL